MAFPFFQLVQPHNKPTQQAETLIHALNMMLPSHTESLKFCPRGFSQVSCQRANCADDFKGKLCALSLFYTEGTCRIFAYVIDGTYFRAAPVTLPRQLCRAFQTSAIEDDGASKIASKGESSNKLLGSCLHRLGMASLVTCESPFQQEKRLVPVIN